MKRTLNSLAHAFTPIGAGSPAALFPRTDNNMKRWVSQHATPAKGEPDPLATIELEICLFVALVVVKHAPAPPPGSPALSIEDDSLWHHHPETPGGMAEACRKLVEEADPSVPLDVPYMLDSFVRAFSTPEEFQQWLTQTYLV